MDIRGAFGVAGDDADKVNARGQMRNVEVSGVGETFYLAALHIHHLHFLHRPVGILHILIRIRVTRFNRDHACGGVGHKAYAASWRFRWRSCLVRFSANALYKSAVLRRVVELCRTDAVVPVAEDVAAAEDMEAYFLALHGHLRQDGHVNHCQARDACRGSRPVYHRRGLAPAGQCMGAGNTIQGKFYVYGRCRRQLHDDMVISNSFSAAPYLRVEEDVERLGAVMATVVEAEACRVRFKAVYQDYYLEGGAIAWCQRAGRECRGD